MIFNFGWLPSWLTSMSRTNEYLRKHKTDNADVAKYGKHVMFLLDQEIERDKLYSDLIVNAKILTECYHNGLTPEECVEKIKAYYDS